MTVLMLLLDYKINSKRLVGISSEKIRGELVNLILTYGNPNLKVTDLYGKSAFSYSESLAREEGVEHYLKFYQDKFYRNELRDLELEAKYGVPSLTSPLQQQVKEYQNKPVTIVENIEEEDDEDSNPIVS